MSLGPLELQYFAAAIEQVRRQRELLPLLAETLGVPPEEVFSAWNQREFPNIRPKTPYDIQLGSIQGTEWGYFFHGLEVDVSHRLDGRFVRIEFGPGGRTDVLSNYSVHQFAMASKPPWPEFPDLKAYIARNPPPYDHFSGDDARARGLWSALQQHELVEIAAPELHQIYLDHLVINEAGQQALRLPIVLSEETLMDMLVCDRWGISPRGWSLAREMRLVQ